MMHLISLKLLISQLVTTHYKSLQRRLVTLRRRKGLIVNFTSSFLALIFCCFQIPYSIAGLFKFSWVAIAIGVVLCISMGVSLLYCFTHYYTVNNPIKFRQVTLLGWLHYCFQHNIRKFQTWNTSSPHLYDLNILKDYFGTLAIIQNLYIISQY